MMPDDSSTPHPPARSAAAPGWSYRRVLGAAVFAALALAFLELLAGLLPLPKDDLGLSGRPDPIFVAGDKEQSDRYVTSPRYLRYASRQSFALRKPPGVFRVFVLGGSAALGWPSGESCGFSGVLRRALDAAAPGRFEIVNASVMSFGSHRILGVLQQVLELEPDLVIVWSGNNEYIERNALTPAAPGESAARVRQILRRSRLYRALRAGLLRFLPAGGGAAGVDLTDLKLDPRVVRGQRGRTAEIDREVLENYRLNLAEMKRLLAASGVWGVFCTVPVNLSGWAPWNSAPRLGDERTSRVWSEQINAGIDLFDRGDPAAVGRFREVTRLTPHYALGSYFLAQALQRRGDLEEAYDAFGRARDDDARVLRAFGVFNETVRHLNGGGTGTTIADLEAVFRRASGQRLVGTDLFFDYCHPNREGHKLAAMALLPGILDKADPSGALAGAATLAASDVCPEPEAPQAAGTAYALALTAENNGRFVDAERRYREVLLLRPEFPEALSNLGLLLLKRGDLAGAEELSARALAADQRNTGAMLQLAIIRSQQGRLDDADSLLRQLLALNADHPDALELRGDLAARRGAATEAVRYYEEAIAQAGGTSRLYSKLGTVLQSAGRRAEARKQWQLAVEFDPLDEDARRRLAAESPP